MDRHETEHVSFATPTEVREFPSGRAEIVAIGGAEIGRLANALRRLGVGAGDTVGVFLPMSQEAAVPILACSRIGPIYAPCFPGYGAPAVACLFYPSDAADE